MVENRPLFHEAFLQVFFRVWGVLLALAMFAYAFQHQEIILALISLALVLFGGYLLTGRAKKYENQIRRIVIIFQFIFVFIFIAQWVLSLINKR